MDDFLQDKRLGKEESHETPRRTETRRGIYLFARSPADLLRKTSISAKCVSRIYAFPRSYDMVIDMTSATQATLLERLREAADPLAWDEFFERYWRLIFSHARRRGCSEHTAEEIVQETMLAVFRQRQVFRYDPREGRFRDWLGAVVRNQVARRRRLADERRQETVAPEQFADAAHADAPPDAHWETEFESALLASLLDIVRHEVAPETYQAFELTALHDLPAADAARLTGLTRNAVYLARGRLLQRLRELGANYAEDGQLSERLKAALAQAPRHLVQRAVSVQVEKSMMEPLP